jgi:hypothetical protein
MRLLYLSLATSILLMGPSSQLSAQSLRLGPGGVEVRPGPDLERRPARRDETRDRMLEFRERCDEGDKRACVRLGILIGENRARREAWRREHPEVFFYERD